MRDLLIGRSDAKREDRTPRCARWSKPGDARREPKQREECDEGGPPAESCSARPRKTKGGPCMLYVGLDLSRKRLDWLVLDEAGERVAVGALPPDRDGLAGLADRVGDAGVLAVIESMTGARFV